MMTIEIAGRSATDRFWRAGPHVRFRSVRSSWQAEGGVFLRTPIDGPLSAARVAAAMEEAGTHGDRPGFACGVVPFDPSEPAALLVPDARWVMVDNGPGLGTPDIALPAVVDSQATPDGADYIRTVNRAREEISTGRLTKVVLGRCLDLNLKDVIDPIALWHRLVVAEPSASHVLASLPGGDVLVGASPELLIAKDGHRVTSHPLAGSAARSTDPAVDEAQALGLLRSEKDLREHRTVVEEVADTLAPYCTDLIVPREPSLVGTTKLWHLGSAIEGQLRDRDQSVLELLHRIQPTPALGGSPRTEALRFIEHEEPFARQYFGGAVGWVNGAGDGEWSVVIRSALLRPRSVRLFAGAGIVEGSVAERELAETHTKLSTILSVLGGGGLDPTGRPLHEDRV